MGQLMIVSKVENLEEYWKIAKEYQVSFEVNDFFDPDILDNEEKQIELLEAYVKGGLPKDSTMHGAFCDIAVFSRDARIRDVSMMRMEQSIQFAKAIKAVGVVFHTNYNADIRSEGYKGHFVDATAQHLEKLLLQNPDIQIYMENMFDTTPEVLQLISKRLCKYPNYGVCLDWAHAMIYGNNIDDWVESLKSYVKHIHINDNDLKGDLHLPIGSGKIDFKQFARYYKLYFKDCTVLVETNGPNDIRRSLEYIKKEIPILLGM